MNIVKTFEEYGKNLHIGRKTIDSAPEMSIGDVNTDIKFSIDITTVGHSRHRQYRHGGSNIISNDDIIDLIEKAVPKLIHATVRNDFDISYYSDKKPIRFGITDMKSNLNLVCEITPDTSRYGDGNFVIKVVTVMIEKEFKYRSNQFVIYI